MKSRQLEANKVDEELKRRSQEIRDLQLRLQDAEKVLVRLLLFKVLDILLHAYNTM